MISLEVETSPVGRYSSQLLVELKSGKIVVVVVVVVIKISKTALTIFLIFCMKLKDLKVRKVTKPDFPGKFWIIQKLIFKFCNFGWIF